AMPMARRSEVGGDGGDGDLGPEMPQSGKSEDLFIFTIDHISLKRGERMVVPVGEASLKYQDLYVLDMPFAPPREIYGSMQGGRAAELARLLAQPKVKHMIRLDNSGPAPLTTAPALVLEQGRLLAQATMTYTARGAQVDLEVGTAIDVAVHK